MNTATTIIIGKEYSPRTLRVAKWIAYFSLIDLLIFPYFQKIIMPFSLPVVMLSFFLLRIKLEYDRYLKMFLLLGFIGVLSVTFSFVLPGDYPNYFVDNLKRLLQLLSSFLYFFYFQWMVRRVTLKITPILVIFVLWFFAFALFFYFDPMGFGELIRVSYGKGVISESDLEVHLRYAYIFSDPNTAAYFFLIATSPLLIQKIKAKWRFLIIVVLILILFIAQSRGAIISLLLVVFFMIFKPSKFIKNMLDVRKIFALLILVLIISATITYVQVLSEENMIVKYALERIFESEDTSTGGNRFNIWATIMSNFYPLPFGRGYNLLINNVIYGPHSDALHLIYSYGFISFFIVVYFLFGKRKNIIPLIIPALIAFLINSLLDEQKVFSVFLIYLAIYTTPNFEQRLLEIQIDEKS